MTDAIPQGYITLPEAFERYFKRKFGSNDLTTEKGDLFAFGRLGEPELHGARCELVSAFSAGELEAHVRRFPDKPENVDRLLPTEWRELNFADRLFMAAVIPEHFRNTPWGGYRGRTPFVSEQAFIGWLARNLSDEQSTQDAAACMTPTEKLIARAVNDLWNGNVPAELLMKERDNQIMQWCRAQNLRAPAERTLRGYFNSK